MRRVLIVSPSFPPASTPDMQRIRMSLPHYPENGWEAFVLTVAIEQQEGLREQELVATIPSAAKIHRCGALPLSFSRLLGLHNLGLRAWWHLLWNGWKIIRREKIDLVFISNTQFVTFLLGRVWRFLLGVPYVIDLQDPWRTDYYERAGSRRPPGGWKYQLARAQAWLLEGWSLRRMSGFMAVSQHYIDDLKKRYPWFGAIPSDAIRFGAGASDLEVARTLPASHAIPAAGANFIRLVYTGASGPIMPHSLNVLFGGLKQFQKIDPVGAARLRFEFLGTSYAPPGQGKATVVPVAEQFGVANQVIEIPHRLGQLECLQIQLSADALLILGSSDLAYSPSKIYPYFLSGRPMLGLVFQHSCLETILQELSCAVLVRFQEFEPKTGAHDQLCAFFSAALAGFPPGTLPTRNETLFHREYLAESLTRRQCALLNRAIADHSAIVNRD